MIVDFFSEDAQQQMLEYMAQQQFQVERLDFANQGPRKQQRYSLHSATFDHLIPVSAREAALMHGVSTCIYLTL